MGKRSSITIEEIAKVVSYDPNTGIMTWLKETPGRAKIGDPAGYLDASTGYTKIGIYYKRYYAHRIAFMLMTGRWPSNQIDHIDGNRANNSWSNIREATRSENMVNRVSPRRLCRKGAYLTPDGNYQSKIMVGRKSIYLGTYKNEEDAHAAYCEAAHKYHGEFARTA